jgi:hypothetical protein
MGWCYKPSEIARLANGLVFTSRAALRSFGTGLIRAGDIVRDKVLLTGRDTTVFRDFRLPHVCAVSQIRVVRAYPDGATFSERRRAVLGSSLTVLTLALKANTPRDGVPGSARYRAVLVVDVAVASIS